MDCIGKVIYDSLYELQPFSIRNEILLLDEFARSLKSRLCERSEAISQFISAEKIEIAASLGSSQ